jgi:hypothetical protein
VWRGSSSRFGDLGFHLVFGYGRFHDQGHMGRDEVCHFLVGENRRERQQIVFAAGVHLADVNPAQGT